MPRWSVSSSSESATRPGGWRSVSSRWETSLTAPIRLILEPPPTRHALQWGGEYRELPPGSAEPGRLRPDRTPYLLPVAAALRNPAYRLVVVICASQAGKTEFTLSAIGQRLTDDPCPVLVVFPTQHAAETHYAPRLSEMINSTPTLRAITAKGRHDKVLSKVVAGQPVRLAWAGSATELSSQAIGFAIVDELDRMDTVRGEGDPLELVRARGITYPDFTCLAISTPSVGSVEPEEGPGGRERWQVGDRDDIESPIWRRWQSGTRQEWCWLCPHCARPFAPRLRYLEWPEDGTNAERARGAQWHCQRCGSALDDGEVAYANAHGMMLGPEQDYVDGKVVGALEDTAVASFWISGGASPWLPAHDLALKWLDAVETHDAATIQPVLNTSFAECFSIRQRQLSWEEVAAKREPYPMGTVPEEARILTGGVDVQADRLVYVIRAWAPGMASWLVQQGELWGPTAEMGVWEDLAELSRQPWGQLGVAARVWVVDSGYEKDRVYAFCRRAPDRYFPSKGQAERARPFSLVPIDRGADGKPLKNGIQLTLVDTDHFKRWVTERMGLPIDAQGAWHLPTDCSDAYCQELVAEAREVLPSGRVRWVNPKKRPNHSFDAETLACVGAHILNFHQVAPVARTVGAASAPPVPPPARPVIQSRWVGRRR